MSTIQCWEAQRETLRASLNEQTDLPTVASAVRHALLQTEQNALAQLGDDVLRQQAGVLFASLRAAVGLMETPVVSTVWEACATKPSKRSKGRVALLGIMAVLQALLGLYCYFRGMELGWIAALAVLALGGAALLFEHRKKPAQENRDELRVTLKPDADQLLDMLDAQMRAVDRYLGDFAYLNEQLRGSAECFDTAMLSRAAELAEALYECDEEERAPAEESLLRLMEGMGLKALNYSEESRGLFTALPSKTETRTLSPAIISVRDARLLRRGTAAVKMDVA